MHSKGYIHRDIKPDNFLIGLEPHNDIVYVLDFGLTKLYKDSSTGNHIAYRNNKRLTGTARYVSVNTHLGVEQSRRDDLEGIMYVMLYFLRGSLPWQGLPARTRREKYRRILTIKSRVKSESLCEGLPIQMKKLLNYCRELKFDETPNYKHMKKLLQEIANKEQFTFDGGFDWISDIPQKKIKEDYKEELKESSNNGVKESKGEVLSNRRHTNIKANTKILRSSSQCFPTYRYI